MQSGGRLRLRLSTGTHLNTKAIPFFVLITSARHWFASSASTSRSPSPYCVHEADLIGRD